MFERRMIDPPFLAVTLINARRRFDRTLRFWAHCPSVGGSPLREPDENAILGDETSDSRSERPLAAAPGIGARSCIRCDGTGCVPAAAPHHRDWSSACAGSLL
jgi:hypothetical protein